MVRRLTRVAVIDGAADFADEVGLEEVTTTRLGRTLGITPPALYRHVADLTDLRGAIGQQAARKLSADLSLACAGLSGHDALKALANTLRTWAATHPGRYAALQIAPDHRDTAGQAAVGELLSTIASVLRAYQLTEEDLTDAIRLVRSTLHGFILLELGGGFKQPRSLDATFERIITSLDAALNAWAA